MGLWLLTLLFCLPVFGIYKTGDTVKDECWFNEEDKKVCLDDHKNRVRVLVYSAGWCLPCNIEAKKLAKETTFAKQPVTFFSVSGEGWRSGSKPGPTFLKEWRAKTGIKYPTLGSFGDFGRDYSDDPAIPLVVILNKGAVLHSVAVAPKHDELLAEIRKALLR